MQIYLIKNTSLIVLMTSYGIKIYFLTIHALKHLVLTPKIP
jgi:hypothetical protein